MCPVSTNLTLLPSIVPGTHHLASYLYEFDHSRYILLGTMKHMSFCDRLISLIMKFLRFIHVVRVIISFLFKVKCVLHVSTAFLLPTHHLSACAVVNDTTVIRES